MSYTLSKIINLKQDFLYSKSSSTFKLISFLFIILPLTLITGPFFPDLILSIIALYFLIYSIKKKLVSYYKSKEVFIFCFFYLFLLLSGILSDYPYESLIGYNGPIFYFRYLFFILGIKFLLSTNPRLIKLFCFSLMITLSFTIIDGYLQWITGSNILGFTPTNTRISGIFNDEQILGHFLSHIVPLAMGLLIYLYGNSKRQIVLIIIFLVISEILIFITNDRSGFLKIFQFSLLIIFLSNNFKLFRLISFGITLIVITFILNTSNSSKDRYSGTVSEISSTSVPYMPMTIHHESHLKIAFNIFKEKPIIGKGPQSFRILCDTHIDYQEKTGCTNHPHNYYFQTLAELGLIGVAFLTSIFFYLSYLLLKQFINLWFRKNRRPSLLPDHLVVLYSLVFILFWPVIPHQSFYNNWLNVIIFLPIGFLLFFSKQNNKL